ncbi:uncharacterized protein F5147DRAFT_650400 [Suillus discolor]|uniref:Uncharacterized protein n=1 Tax=Suillus discolor TaxID=1912936 RepID=A0A9P7JWY7_9AGAM|nr:uncharacterized protein F5147DRAFT_650400 [Suillus discolor]KAG2113470.1 hypothetical protein F5147DRAFT_650400 [Suillus discolor]
MSSLTSPSMMIASGKVSSATDHAVKNTEDITLHLKFCRECIENVKLGDGQVIYVLQTSAVDSVVVNKILVDPFEVDITIDTSALIVTVQIYIDLPIVGPLLLAQAMGALKFNSDIEINFNGTPGDLASGVAGVKMDATNNVVLSWDFASFGVETKGSYIIVHI